MAYRSLLALLLSLLAVDAQAEELAPRFATKVQPLLKRYCHGCHGGSDPQADIDLARFAEYPQVLDEMRLWKQVHDALRNREMPPEDKPQPTDDERELLTAWTMEMQAGAIRPRNNSIWPAAATRATP